MSTFFLPYKSANTEKARRLRKNMTEAENRLWYCVLRNRTFHNIKFVRQKTIDNFIVDFYAAEVKLAIEVDGDTHGERKLYDEIRTHCLNRYGITVLRYTNTEVFTNLEGVWLDLENKLKPHLHLP